MLLYMYSVYTKVYYIQTLAEYNAGMQHDKLVDLLLLMTLRRKSL